MYCLVFNYGAPSNKKKRILGLFHIDWYSGGKAQVAALLSLTCACDLHSLLEYPYYHHHLVNAPLQLCEKSRKLAPSQLTSFKKTSQCSVSSPSVNYTARSYSLPATISAVIKNPYRALSVSQASELNMSDSFLQMESMTCVFCNI